MSKITTNQALLRAGIETIKTEQKRTHNGKEYIADMVLLCYNGKAIPRPFITSIEKVIKREFDITLDYS